MLISERKVSVTNPTAMAIGLEEKQRERCSWAVKVGGKEGEVIRENVEPKASVSDKRLGCF